LKITCVYGSVTFLSESRFSCRFFCRNAGDPEYVFFRKFKSQLVHSVHVIKEINEHQP
jgi:hypothetical protein